MKGYGLQLRINPAQHKKPVAPKPPTRPPAFAFGGDDDDDVEREISRQSSKNKALQKIEEQHKKAMEEDPSVFDYDGVYDVMKEEIARPRIEDRTERKSKYIERLMAKSKEREREREVIYERKLSKERNKDDHLFADKEKFVTSAYKKKLAEQEKWLEEERLRQIREEKEDVTKKSDLSDFYFGLTKNVAFGAQSEEAKRRAKENQANDRTQEIKVGQSKIEAPACSTQDTVEVENQAENASRSPNHSEHAATTSEEVVVDATSAHDKIKVEQALANQVSDTSYKRNEDALAAARERFLARKRTREQY